MENQMIGVIALSITVLGFLLAYLYGHKTKKFRISEYIALLVAPIISVAIYAHFYGPKVWVMFFFSAVLGLMLEYGIGLVYHKILNRRLWTYSRLNLNGYTSWLTLPLWGIGGIFFWVLSMSVGL